MAVEQLRRDQAFVRLNKEEYDEGAIEKELRASLLELGGSAEVDEELVKQALATLAAAEKGSNILWNQMTIRVGGGRINGPTVDGATFEGCGAPCEPSVGSFTRFFATRDLVPCTNFYKFHPVPCNPHCNGKVTFYEMKNNKPIRMTGMWMGCFTPHLKESFQGSGAFIGPK